MKQKGRLGYTLVFFLICIFFSAVALHWELKHRAAFRRSAHLKKISTRDLVEILEAYYDLKSCRDPFMEHFLDRAPLLKGLNRLWLLNSNWWPERMARELRRRGAAPPQGLEALNVKEEARAILEELKRRRRTKTLLYEIDSLLGGYFGVFLEVRSLEFFLAWGRATRRRLLGKPLKRLFAWFCRYFNGLVIPCQDSLEGRPRIVPYENVLTLLQRAGVGRIQPCSCKAYYLPADRRMPRDTCMGFFYVEDMSDLSREGYRTDFTVPEKVMAKLKECEEYGLVHQVMTVSRPEGRKGYVLCNCHADSCIPLVLYLQYGIPMVRGSGLTVQLTDPSRCTLCLKCVNRCMFKAVYLKGDVPALDEVKCLGCGLCVSTCPAQIRRLVPGSGMKETA
ncbi:MAG TPA: 4Fe-4S binding protein [Bacillota bacterium]|nr:4Fe-4S binding protein [Bacillota bacterium]